MDSSKRRQRPPALLRRVRRDLTSEVVLGFYEALDTPVSLTCAMLYRSGEHCQLVTKSLDPSKYSDPQAFYLDYLAVRLLSRCAGLETGINTRAVATEEFLRCESKCRTVNDQLVDLYAEDPVISLNKDSDWRFSDIICWLQCKISDVLGTYSWEEVYDKCRFGPGATTRIRGTKTSAYEKFQGTLHSTRGALPHCLYLSEQWDLFPHKFQVVLGNVVTFVLKNAKTDRTIAMEPDGNQFLQLGQGIVMRDCLRGFSVDIRDQTRNQRLAFRGSLFGSHSTVDMKSASGLIARILPALVLPEDWYEALKATRSPTYELDGCVTEYYSFSSMGNGYTFPLQTLIFWALACLACKMSNVGSRDVGAYGDDLVVPPEAYLTFLRLLNLFGLEPNSEKSYSVGPFRESCGKDYFDGWDCQPLYLRDQLKTAGDLLKFANKLRRLSYRARSGTGCDRRFEALWRYCVSYLPHELRTTYVPEGYGDGGLMVSFEEACPQRAPYMGDGRRHDFVVGWLPYTKGDPKGLPLCTNKVEPLGLEGWTYYRFVFKPAQYEMEDELGARRYVLFRAQGIEIPPRGWMVNGRTVDDETLEIVDRPFDAYEDFERVAADPKGHVRATHRRLGRYVRRKGVARNWPSLGGWY